MEDMVRRRRRNITTEGDIELRTEYPHYPYCKKTNHTYSFCWCRPRVQCKVWKQFDHVDKVCKTNQNHPAKVTENVEEHEEKLFAASIIAGECNIEA